MTEAEREALIDLITETLCEADPRLASAAPYLALTLALKLERADFYYLPRVLPGEGA